MSAGKIIGYVLAAIAILFGVLFLLAAFNGQPVSQATGDLVVAAVLIGIGIVIIVAIKLREPKPKQVIEQKIDLTGDIDTSKLKCKNCGADLDKDSITVVAGAVMINCPYCGSSYQMIEQPKW
jgi:hypothetical protein